jgi:hypothetical protein
MTRLTLCLALAISAVAATASAQPKPEMPKTGDSLALTGSPDWPQKLSWLYEAPSASDAAGKVVVHWFCSASTRALAKSCATDLDRVIALRDTGHVYVVAYIGGGGAEAKKLDPIRESEGVGRGTVAYGPQVVKLMKQLGVTEAAIVVDVDGKVKAVTTSGDLNELDARDKVVTGLAGDLRDFTTSHENPASVHIGEKFPLTFKVQLASWLAYSQSAPMEFTVTLPRDIKCDATTLHADRIKLSGQMLIATVTCSGPRGNYEAQGKIRFGYDSPGGAHGTGEDGATYKFEIK